MAFAAAPFPRVPPEVLKWIDQLGDEDSDTRKLAEKKLFARGEDVLPALRRAKQNHDDPDVRLRSALLATAIQKTIDGEVRQFIGHTEGVNAFALSPDGKRMVSGSWGGSAERVARVWDVDTGKELFQLEGHEGSVPAVAWFHDGKQILTAGHDARLRIWDAANGKVQRAYFGFNNGLVGVAITLDDKKAACCCSHPIVRIFDLKLGNELAQTYVSDTKNVRGVAVMPDGKHFLTACLDGKVRLHELEQAKVVRTMDGTHKEGAWSIAVSRDGKRIASVGADKVVRLHDPATGKEIKTFSGHTDSVQAIAFSPDGKRLLSGGRDKSVRLWDVASGKEIQCIRQHTDVVTCVAFIDARHAITSSLDKTLRLWKLRP
jgi:WD40 repeat protein